MSAGPDGIPDAYRELERHFAAIGDVEQAGQMLRWDQATMMPAGGAEARATQLATLDGLAHRMLADPRISGLLDDAEAEADRLDAWQSANLREMRRIWRHAQAVPAELVEALSAANSACELCWRTARPTDDFALVAPLLGRVLELTRELAAHKADALGCAPYDALLDEYESGARAERIDALFAELEAALPGILDAVTGRQAAAPPPKLAAGPFAMADQKALGRQVMQVFGFDFARGRLDESDHPFTGGVPDDVRLTTRYEAGNFLPGLLAIIHETGHALYEQGLPPAWRRQPVGQARGMVLHESQSLLMEMQIARSDAFLAFIAPVLERALGFDPAFEPGNLARLTRRVTPSLIRVEADEVTYPLHVILRYRIERALIAGELAVSEISEAWNAGMRTLLGIAPPDNRTGCLQDVHWFGGAFGYFPTYTLGALAAAQLFAAAREAEPGLLPALAAGDLTAIRDWLRRAIHARASSTSTAEILENATGAPLGADAFLAHLRARYLS